MTTKQDETPTYETGPTDSCFGRDTEGCSCHWPAGPLPKNVLRSCDCCNGGRRGIYGHLAATGADPMTTKQDEKPTYGTGHHEIVSGHRMTDCRRCGGTGITTEDAVVGGYEIAMRGLCPDCKGERCGMGNLLTHDAGRCGPGCDLERMAAVGA